MNIADPILKAFPKIDQVVFGAGTFDTFADLLLAAEEHAKATAAK